MFNFDSDDYFKLSSIIIYNNNERIKEYVFDMILNFINFNKEFEYKKTDGLADINEFYAINVEWMKEFLGVGVYEKILKLIQNYDKEPKKIDEIDLKEKKKIISENINEINKKNISLNFIPNKEKLFINGNNNILYFSEFILVDKNINRKIKKIIEFREKIANVENKINIIISGDRFIYIINNNILGHGVLPILQKNENYYIFKVKHLLIFDNEYNYETELITLKKSNDINYYLRNERHVNLDDINVQHILYNRDKTKEIGVLFFVEKKNNEKYITDRNSILNYSFKKKDEKKLILNNDKYTQLNLNNINNYINNNDRYSNLYRYTNIADYSTIFSKKYQRKPDLKYSFQIKPNTKDIISEGKIKSNEDDKSFISESLEESQNNQDINENILENLRNSLINNYVEDNSYNNYHHNESYNIDYENIINRNENDINNDNNTNYNYTFSDLNYNSQNNTENNNNKYIQYNNTNNIDFKNNNIDNHSKDTNQNNINNNENSNIQNNNENINNENNNNENSNNENNNNENNNNDNNNENNNYWKDTKIEGKNNINENNNGNINNNDEKVNNNDDINNLKYNDFTNYDERLKCFKEREEEKLNEKYQKFYKKEDKAQKVNENKKRILQQEEEKKEKLKEKLKFINNKNGVLDQNKIKFKNHVANYRFKQNENN